MADGTPKGTPKGSTVNIVKIRQGRYQDVQVKRGGSRGIGWTVIGKTRYGTSTSAFNARRQHG